MDQPQGTLPEWIPVADAARVLRMKKTKAYELRHDKSIADVLGRAIRYRDEDKLAYHRDDVLNLGKHFEALWHRKVIVIVQHKGGVGKSTAAACIGVLLAREGNNVLLVDSDFQGNLTDLFCRNDSGQLEDGVDDKNLFSLFERTALIEHVIHKTRVPGLDIIPADERLSEVGYQKISKNFIKSSLSGLTGYHYVIVDTPPSLSELTPMFLNAATSVLIPIMPSAFSAKGLLVLQKTLILAKQDNKNLKVLGAFLNIANKKYGVTKIMPDLLSANINLFDSTISNSTEVEKAHLQFKTIAEVSPEHQVSQDYAALVEEIMEQERLNGE